MKCRTDIAGRKIWVDNDNSFDTRPENFEVVLYQDGEVKKTLTLSSAGDGSYRFPCQVVWKDGFQKYVYTVDEPNVPANYTKLVQGNNILNILIEFPLTGTKTWVDNNDLGGLRPNEVTLRLFQNGTEIDFIQLASPTAPQNIESFDFGMRPYADASGVPYTYEIREDAVANYQTTIEGFNITNTLNIIP